jgi:hypothetical protein
MTYRLAANGWFLKGRKIVKKFGVRSVRFEERDNHQGTRTPGNTLGILGVLVPWWFKLF